MNVYEEFDHEGVTVQIVYDEDPQSVNPLTEQDNAGTLYSWTPEFSGDQRIPEPDLEILCPICEGEESVPTHYVPDADWTECRKCHGEGVIKVSLEGWFEEHYGAALTVPLSFEEQRYGARIYVDEDDPNCALVFTQKEVDEEWDGHVEAYQVPTFRWIFAEEGDPVVGYADGGKPLRERVPDGTGESGARPYAKARIEELNHWLQGNVFSVIVKDADGEILESVGGFIGDPDAEWFRDEVRWIAEAASKQVRKEHAECEYWMARDTVTV